MSLTISSHNQSTSKKKRTFFGNFLDTLSLIVIDEALKLLQSFNRNSYSVFFLQIFFLILVTHLQPNVFCFDLDENVTYFLFSPKLSVNIISSETEHKKKQKGEREPDLVGCLGGPPFVSLHTLRCHWLKLGYRRGFFY